MEELYGVIISVLLGINILIVGWLIRIFVANNKKVASIAEENSKSILLMGKDVTGCIRSIESAKKNIYEVREILQRHNDRIIIVEEHDKNEAKKQFSKYRGNTP